MSESKGRLFWLTLCAVYLVGAGIFSTLAPLGTWENRMFTFPLWWDSDPGGWYLASAHELFASNGKPLYPGHPGLTLQMLLRGTEQVFYLLKADRGEELTSFVARNLHQFGFIARMLMTLLHLVSFYLLFLFSRRLSGSARAARLAALGYATSLPVLYYLSRISVEPLVVIFFFATFIGLWDYRECLLRGAKRRAIGLAAVAAVLAVSGFVTKLHLLAPLPIFGLLWVVTMGPRKSEPPVGSAWKVRAWAAAAFALASSATLFFYSMFMNWGEFFYIWQIGNESTRANTIRKIEGLKSILTADNLLPDASVNGIFLLCEFSFLAVAMVGVIRFFRRRDADRGAALWPLALAAYTFAVFAYRGARTGDLHGFHYLFVVTAVLAVFFGMALDELGRAFPGRTGGLVALGAVLLVHQVPVWGVLDSRIQDARAYRPLKPFQEALERVDAGQKVGLIQRGKPVDLFFVHGLSASWSPSRRPSVLVDEFASLFVPVGVRKQPPGRLAERLREARVQVVVDLDLPGGRGEVYDALEWANALDPIGELLSKLPTLNKTRDPELRQRVLTAMLDGALESIPLGDDRVRLAGVTRKRWTVGDQPAVVAVENSSKRDCHVKLRLGLGAQPAGVEVSVFVDDGQDAVEYGFEGGSTPWVPLSIVPAGASQLFLVWMESPADSVTGDPGKLGIRFNAAQVRKRDRD